MAATILSRVLDRLSSTRFEGFAGERFLSR